MRILLIHNLYQKAGGEDAVVQAEKALLEANGHEVELYLETNDRVEGMNRLQLAGRTVWSLESWKQIDAIVQRFRPHLAHLHNTFPLISPSVFHLLHKSGIPSVQTLHNYRLLCPAATFFRNGRVCEDCVGHTVPYPGAIHGCYRRSRTASSVVAGMLTAHRLAGTWTNKVTAFIALTEFAKRKLSVGGLPAEKIKVKPNFLANDPGVGGGCGGFALFVGRLSEEKGLRTLVKSFRALPGLCLKIVGQGPLEDELRAETASMSNVEIVGFLEKSAVFAMIQSAKVLILPSEWYEGFPMTAVEAMACGTPIVASALGSLAEVIVEGENGFLFEASNEASLSDKLQAVFSSEAALQGLRLSSRKHYELFYSAERNYSLLIKIYESALKSCAST
jgi:glycosyltransferase involved in cell wall biosynthesis